MALPALLGQPVPFSPVQIIVLELLMDLGASVSFAAEPAEGDVMRRPPLNPGQRFLDRSLSAIVLLGGPSLGVAVPSRHAWAQGPADLTDVRARTVAFLTWLLGHVVLALAFRSEREPLSRLGVFSIPVALVWMAAGVTVAALSTTVPLLSDRVGAVSIPEAWLRAVVVPVATTAGFEIAKWLRRPGSASARR